MTGPMLPLLLLLAAVQVTAAAPTAALASPAKPEGLIPRLEGWTSKEAPRSYSPDNLYEYIDGAADGFLDCDFQELLLQVYEGRSGRSITLEVYRHADPACAFGIYSQERPAQGPFLALGAQGYYESGILNFVKGDRYVKLSGFGLGAEDREEQLMGAATAVAARLPGDTSLPRLLKAFPAPGKVPHSEKYLRRNVLGYPFLECAYAADYTLAGKKLGAYILDPGGEAQARSMLAGYLKSQGRMELPGSGLPIAVQDPHHGPLTLLLARRFLIVAVGSAPVDRELAQRIQAELKAY